MAGCPSKTFTRLEMMNICCSVRIYFSSYLEWAELQIMLVSFAFKMGGVFFL